MKKIQIQKALATLLASAILLSATACTAAAPSSSAQGDDKAESKAAESTAESTATESTAADPSGDSTAKNAESVTVNMLLMTDGNSADKEKQVEDAINAILEPALNTRVEFTKVGYADHTQKVNLMLASGDKLDLFEPFQSYDNFYTNGYMMDISGYSEYYKDITALLGEDYMKSAQINGVQYGLPSLKDLAIDSCILIRTDILEELNVKIDDVKSFDDFEALLKKMKEKYPDVTPIMGGSQGSALGNVTGNIDTGVKIDNLGNTLGVLLNPVSDPTISNWYASEEYAKICNYAYSWKQQGLMDRDNLTSGLDLLRAGKTFTSGYALSPKAEAEGSTSAGHAMTAWSYYHSKPLAITSNSWSWCINSNSEIPERTLEMLNFMYTNKEIQNLLAWGIEGEDYQVISDEGVGEIDYVEGQDSGSVKYYQWTKYSFPNNFLQYVMKGNDPHQWEKMDEWNKSADISLAMGFNFDATKIMTQIAACTNVVNEYHVALTGGEIEPKAGLSEFNKKLEDAGINAIVTEKQAQLDAWLAATGKK